MHVAIAIFIFIILCILYLLHKKRLSNILVTTFSLIWVLEFFVQLTFNTDSFKYLTFNGILIIFLHVFIVLVGYIFFIIGSHKVIKPIIPFIFKLNIKKMYFFLLFLTIIGLVLQFRQVDLLTALLSSQLSTLRGDILSGEIIIPKSTVIFTNFIYPLAILTPFFSFTKRKIHFLIISILIFLLYALSNGGKGGIVSTSILMVGAIIFLKRHNIIEINNQIKRYFLILILIIISYMTFINYTRGLLTTDNPNTTQTFDTFTVYFGGSVPAFCQLIDQKEWSLFSIDLRDHVIIREISGFFGHKITRTIDQNIVYVPYKFNVFTSFADSLFSIGLIGSLFYYFSIGMLFGYINTISKRINRIFLFAVLFLFAFMSFYVDVFYFMFGSWYCVMFFILFGIDYNDGDLPPQINKNKSTVIESNA